MTFTNPKYPNAIVEIVEWPNTVFRVVSTDRDVIATICEEIRLKWVSYTDPSLEIIAVDEEGIHSALSPTVVKTARGYEMSLILRNNMVSEKYPDGIFHAHPEFHVIKKESIGLIEAQGLFILPGRLEQELGEIKELIHSGKGLTNELADYQMVYEEIVELCNGDYSLENISRAIEDELGSVCSRILENTAVFKDRKYSVEFLEDLGFSQTK
jgi:UDPglucose--hexose-1-phosphate uridylyltransferase